MQFLDRYDAGRRLGAELHPYADRHDVVVLALPRGGVPVGAEVARALQVPLDVFVVRKLGLPGQEELAMGAIASGGVRVVNEQMIDALGISKEKLDAITMHEKEELERREQLYRGGRPPARVEGKTVILVDDGVATGASMNAAVEALQLLQPAKVIVAVPTGARATCSELRTVVDEVVCLHESDSFRAVGLWYRDFSQTQDEEVCRLLEGSPVARS